MTEAPDRSAAGVLVMNGDVDIATELDWRARGAAVLAANPAGQDVVADLGGVGFLDSRGMAVLVHLHTAARARGGTLILRRVPPRIARALNVAGLDQVFEVHGD